MSRSAWRPAKRSQLTEELVNVIGRHRNLLIIELIRMVVDYASPTHLLYGWGDSILVNYDLRRYPSSRTADGCFVFCMDETGREKSAHAMSHFFSPCCLFPLRQPLSVACDRRGREYFETVVLGQTIYVLTCDTRQFYAVDVSQPDSPELQRLGFAPRTDANAQVRFPVLTATKHGILMSGGSTMYLYVPGNALAVDKAWEEVGGVFPSGGDGHTLISLESSKCVEARLFKAGGGHRGDLCYIGHFTRDVNSGCQVWWQSVGSLNDKRWAHSAVLFDNHVVVAGGKSKIDRRVDSVEVLNLARPEYWVRVLELPVALSDVESLAPWKLVSANGELLAFQYQILGSVESDRVKVYELDIHSKAFNRRADITTPKHAIRAENIVPVPLS